MLTILSSLGLSAIMVDMAESKKVGVEGLVVKLGALEAIKVGQRAEFADITEG